MAGDLLVALAIGEEPVEQVDRLVGRSRRGVGTEVPAAVVDDLAGGDDARPFLVGDPDVGIRLAVFQHDVVLGPVLLDQFVFEDQRFGGGVRADDLEIGDVRDELARFHVLAALRLEVGAHAVAEGNGLAHVDDLAVGVLHQIDARFLSEGSESFLEIGGFVHLRLHELSIANRNMRSPPGYHQNDRARRRYLLVSPDGGRRDRDRAGFTDPGAASQGQFSDMSVTGDRVGRMDSTSLTNSSGESSSRAVRIGFEERY